MKKNFVTIGVNSLESSIAFYKEILNFKENKRLAPAPGLQLVFLENENNFKIELVDREDSEPIDYSTSPFTLTFMVDDLDSRQELLEQKSIVFTRFPLPTGIDIIRFSDPDGLGIAFIKD